MISFHYHAPFEFPRALFQIPHAVLKKLKKSQTTHAAQETNKQMQQIPNNRANTHHEQHYSGDTDEGRTVQNNPESVEVWCGWLGFWQVSSYDRSICLFFFIKYVLSVWLISWCLGSVITGWWWEHNGRIWQSKMGKNVCYQVSKNEILEPSKGHNSQTYSFGRSRSP